LAIARRIDSRLRTPASPRRSITST
jgi:hypothetical protein